MTCARERSREISNANTGRALLGKVADSLGGVNDMIVAPDAPDLDKLTDPNAVHINMLRGTIAKPSLEQIIHVYGQEALRDALSPAAARPDGVGEDCLIVFKMDDGTTIKMSEAEYVGTQIRQAIEELEHASGKLNELLKASQIDLSLDQDPVVLDKLYVFGMLEFPSIFVQQTLRRLKEMDALRRRAAPVDGWQPIETAPKDGRTVWVWLYATGIRRVRWQSPEECAASEDNEDASAYDGVWQEIDDPQSWWAPDFWMPLASIPLPAPPARSAEEGDRATPSRDARTGT